LIKVILFLKNYSIFGSDFYIFSVIKLKGIVVEIENLFIEPTAKTPQIDLNHLTGIFSWNSIPENAAKLYENVLKWVQDYIVSPKHTTNLRINLEYFNTSSTIWISKIVRTLCSMKEIEHTVMIHLYFDIEDFDNMDDEDHKDALSPIIDMVGSPTISVGIKIYGTDEKGKILKESIVLI
jgi:hypothetical protein